MAQTRPLNRPVARLTIVRWIQVTAVGDSDPGGENGLGKRREWWRDLLRINSPVRVVDMMISMKGVMEKV